MQKLVWQNANDDEINLTGGNYGITEWEGFSNASLNIQNQQVPFQDGAVFLDALIEPRELSVTLKMQDNGNLEERYRMRRELIHALNPKLGEGYLIYTNDFTSKRIKCVAQIPLFETHNSNNSGTPKASLSWTACEPYWEDIEEKKVVLTGGDNNLIKNDGDVPCSIKCHISGNNLIDPYIKNNNNNKIIKLNGEYNLNININTGLGQKEIYQDDIDFNNIIFNGISKHCSYYCKELNLFIIGCLNGIIFTSKNGIDWAIEKSNTQYSIGDIYYNSNLRLLIAVGKSGLILTSPNGKDWTNQTSGVNYNIVRVINGYNNKIIALTSNNSILSSDDGMVWSEIATIPATIRDICYSQKLNKYLAVGGNRSIYKSSDGETWEQVSISSGDNAFNSVVYSEERELFVVVGTTGTAWNSTDGENWQNVTINPSGSSQVSLSKIYYIPEKSIFVVLAMGIIISETGLANSWIKISDNVLTSVSYSNNLGIYIGTSGAKLYMSYNLKTWETISDNQDVETTIKSIAYSEKLKMLCAVTDWYIGISTDSKNWDFNFVTNTGSFVKIIYAKDMFIAVGTNSIIAKSNDGINWTIDRINPSIHFNSIVYAEDKDLFVIVGTGGKIYTSSDAIDWTEQTSGTSKEIFDITYSEKQGLFVAVAIQDDFYYKRSVLKSSNGINWSLIPLVSDYNPKAITYSKSLDLFVVVGFNGLISTSTNGVDWFVLGYQTVNRKNIIYSEYYGSFVAVGEDGSIITSPDGKNWQDKSVNINIDLYSCAFSEILNNFIIGGQKATIFTSKEINKENIINNLDGSSDMNFNLEIGDNNILLSTQIGEASGFLIYRQKYIGV